MSEQMEAGTGLDAAVAERVMGRQAEIRGGYAWRVTECGLHPMPEYSADWAAAGQVAERMAEKGYEVEIGIDSRGRYGSFYKEDDWFIEQADTVPHAISLAALAAMEAQCASES